MEFMILKQYYLNCLAHASYLLGDEASSTAIVVDPQRDIQKYLDDAETSGLLIRHVFLTHFHADFVAGHLELRDRCGARSISAPARKREYELRGDERRRARSNSRGCACKYSKPPATPSSPSRSWCSTSRKTRNLTPFSRAIRCSSETWAARTCAPRSDGQPTNWAHTFTTHSTRNS